MCPPIDFLTSLQSERGVALGNEREELQKGLEILERTWQWFNHRLGQLALEKSSNKKVGRRVECKITRQSCDSHVTIMQFGTEELLAIMEGSKPSPADQTLRHLQQINSHLSSLARSAPSLLLSDQPMPSKRIREHKRLSDPGNNAMQTPHNLATLLWPVRECPDVHFSAGFAP